MSDEIIKEVWKIKDRIAKRFQYDVVSLAAELRRRQERSGRKTVKPKKRVCDGTAQ